MKKPKTTKGTLYCYVQRGNEKYAKTEGTKKFGSYSNYVNNLIAKDRGLKRATQTWATK